MKTYIFYYFDSVYEFRAGKKQEYIVDASRFSVAFKSFCNFVRMSCFYYFNFLDSYKVVGDTISYRVYPTKYYVQLDSMRKLKDD